MKNELERYGIQDSDRTPCEISTRGNALVNFKENTNSFAGQFVGQNFLTS